MTSAALGSIVSDTYPNLTVGQLRERFAELPDDAPVYFERIIDFYFDGKAQAPWEVLKIPNGAHPQLADDEFIRAHDASALDGRGIIFGHY